MQIRTHRGEEISVDFAFAPTTSGHMVIKLKDDGQRLSEICEMFEGVTRFEYQDERQMGAPVTLFDGYTRLMRASREGGAIMLTLSKEG